MATHYGHKDVTAHDADGTFQCIFTHVLATLPDKQRSKVLCGLGLLKPRAWLLHIATPSKREEKDGKN